ncbi:hypothetical protein FGSG_11866 [Fusarium graminearum PH-1]|nr:hypothetical protein FGSG_11866 [Fusarium graminearum PH-1]ESU06219.1 hypothetical protein FGSG_11866 [Fusarium graminearum PH-1]|eukprot:XP_011316704.1 hypothetical protein FGSG_11866 [Fusarium graminearum PH-1]
MAHDRLFVVRKWQHRYSALYQEKGTPGHEPN